MLRAEIVLDTVEERLAAGLPHAECLSDGGNHQVGVADRGQRDVAQPVGKGILEVGCDVQAQARLANAGRADQGQQADVSAQEHAAHRRDLLVTADQRGRRRRQVGRTRLPWCESRGGERPGEGDGWI